MFFTKKISVLLTLLVSTILFSTSVFAGDFDNDFDDDFEMPVITTDYATLGFDIVIDGSAGALGFGSATNGNGDSVGFSSGISTTIVDIGANLTAGTCGGCASLGGELTANLGAVNQMVVAAEGVEGGLFVEAASVAGTSAWGSLTALREGTLIDAGEETPADDDDGGE